MRPRKAPLAWALQYLPYVCGNTILVISLMRLTAIHEIKF
jgi:hypothetical protein